jgi:hypothetical protein
MPVDATDYHLMASQSQKKAPLVSRQALSRIA